jgi:hypothetical protein
MGLVPEHDRFSCYLFCYALGGVGHCCLVDRTKKGCSLVRHWRQRDRRRKKASRCRRSCLTWRTKMKFVALAGLVAGSVVGAVSSGSALTVEWRDADGVPCDVVCGASYFAVSSGRSVHPDARLHGRTFYVCRANAGEQGLRPGYNLRPNWAAACWVGHDGKEKWYSDFACLCAY